MEDQIYVLPENMSIYLHQNPPFQPQEHVIEFMWKDESSKNKELREFLPWTGSEANGHPEEFCNWICL